MTVRVTAATGGAVEAKDGKAKLNIPAGALAADTDITVTILARAGAAVVEIASFGPDGLKFLKPALLELKADAALAPQGKSLAVAYVNGDTFEPIAGSTYDNGIAKAPIEHFSAFTVVIVDGNVTLVDPAGCQDARAKFVACGGDPKGTWQFADLCPDLSALGSKLDPFKGKCAQYQYTIDYTSTQEVTIDATTVRTAAGQTTLKFTGEFPLSCGQNDAGTAQCSSFSNSSGACADKGGGICRCEYADTDDKAAEAPKGYTINGSIFTTEGGSSGEYCVSGDVLYYRETRADAGTPLLYVLKRKK